MSNFTSIIEWNDCYNVLPAQSGVYLGAIVKNDELKEISFISYSKKWNKFNCQDEYDLDMAMSTEITTTHWAHIECVTLNKPTTENLKLDLENLVSFISGKWIDCETIIRILGLSIEQAFDRFDFALLTEENAKGEPVYVGHFNIKKQGENYE